MCFEKLNSFFLLGCANSKIQKTRQGSKVFGLVWKSTFVTSGLRLVSLMRAISCYLTYGGQLAGKRSNNGPQYVPRVTWNGGRGVLTGGREDQPSPLWKPYLEPTVGQLRPAAPPMSFSLGWFDLKSLRKFLWSSPWLSSWPESDFMIFAGFGGWQVKLSGFLQKVDFSGLISGNQLGLGGLCKKYPPTRLPLIVALPPILTSLRIISS